MVGYLVSNSITNSRSKLLYFKKEFCYLNKLLH